MRARSALLCLLIAACQDRGAILRSGAAPAGSRAPPAAAPRDARRELRAPETFAKILDPGQRSVALFLEASRVLTDARCVNCHPAGDTPLQGDARALHDPPVTRGPDGSGEVGMRCGSCHQETNLELARVPGAPHWRLAPLSMAWFGKSPAQICAELKDPERNGQRTLAQIVDHSTHDALVGWGFHPGADRRAAPGDQARFGALISAWVATGAVCPGAETGS